LPITDEEFRKEARKLMLTFIGIMTLKWIIIFGLNRWYKALSK
jgi:hypothetical protein